MKVLGLLLIFVLTIGFTGVNAAELKNDEYQDLLEQALQSEEAQCVLDQNGEVFYLLN